MAVSAGECAADDQAFKKWTFLRYAVLSLIMFIRAVKIKNGGKQKTSEPDDRKFPLLTDKMINSGFVMGVFYAGLVFIQSEGVGLVLYFFMSAVLDNFTVFVVGHPDFCDHIMAIALYGMALFTFLPNCWVAIKYQRPWYDEGGIIGKIKFVVVIALFTAVFFTLRLFIVYDLGWSMWMNDIFYGKPYGSLLLVIASKRSERVANGRDSTAQYLALAAA